MAREKHLKSKLDEFITIRECEYRAKMVKNDPPLLNFYWNKSKITQDDIIAGILDDSFFGLCKVDIVSLPEAVRKSIFPKFKKVQIILGGGSRNLWTFSTNYGIFYFEPSP